MSYEERHTPLAGVVLWRQVVEPGTYDARILPDGCMDLLWDGARLLVAGPDTAARFFESRPGDVFSGLRCSGGTGPALLGIAADEVCDQVVELEAVWPVSRTRVLTERVAHDPSSLEAWVGERAPDVEPDPLGRWVHRMASSSTPVSVMADELGLSARQLHRRCLPLIGYGPKLLARVLRLTRALDRARAGRSLGEVAVATGYSDQAHFTREVRQLTGTTPVSLLAESASPRQG